MCSMSKGSHLQLESVLQIVTETEQVVWNQGGIGDQLSDQPILPETDVGSVILRHGTYTEHIHKHFMRLEQRKCCLLLAACKQRFASVRLVGNDERDNGLEESMIRGHTVTPNNVSCLDTMEFQLFQNVLKCAEFPVLGAPEPPSVHTPTPGGQRGAGTNQRQHKLELFKLTKQSVTLALLHKYQRNITDDIAMVPVETLSQLLMRVFRLSVDTYNTYFDSIARSMEKKSPQKILAEELVRQLIALENNNNPFYNPRSFQNRLVYDKWQQTERTQITDLLNKFWHYSLPQLADRTVQMKMLHDQYRLLMEKMIQYEAQFREAHVSQHPVSLLSSASARLLKEFGLRYGVGEQFRKIVYFNFLSVNFDPSLWFIQHVVVTLTSLIEVMPGQRSNLVIVKEELTLLESSLNLLELKVTAALNKMKTLYPDPKDNGVVDLVIDLLSLTLQSQSYLLMSPLKSLKSLLHTTVQSIFPTTYERHKIVALDELRQNKWEAELSPNLLNMLIGNIREEVLDYKQKYQATFQKHFNITVEAAKSFYELLMVDVAALHRLAMKEGMSETFIDRLQLSLAFRLNQLDSDWSDYIIPQMQTWRTVFSVQAQHWASVLKIDMKRFISEIVSTDKYESCEVECPTMVHVRQTPQQRHTPQVPSFCPSLNSAFSSPSSINTRQGKDQSSLVQEIHEDEQKRTDRHSFVKLSLPQPTSSSLYDIRPSSDPVNIGHSSRMGDTYLGDISRSLGHYDSFDLLSFTHIRHSSSMPNMNTAVILKDVPSKVTPECPKDVTPASSPKTRASKSLTNFGSHSTEVENFFAVTPMPNAPHGDDDDSSTITEDSLSQEEFAEYPPLQEVISSTPVPSTDFQPVTVISDTNGTSLVSPQASVGQKAPERLQASKKVQIPGKNDSSLYPDGKFSMSRTVFENKSYRGRYVGENLQESFTDSLLSAISFPLPQDQRTTLPISSSVINVIVMLQRLVGFGKSLCRTLFPQQQRSYESDQMSSEPQSNDWRHMYPPGLCKEQQQLYECFLRAIRQTVSVYGDNMLCMDLCGTTSYTASRLAGSRLIHYLKTQQTSGLVWGCRHNLPTSPNRYCFLYLDRDTPLLCDKHEPITEDMCIRINNVSAIITCLDWFHRQLAIAFNIISDLTVHSLHQGDNSSSRSDGRSDFVFLDSYSYHPDLDSSEVMETVSQILPTDHHQSGIRNITVTSPVEPDRDHLLAELRALCRIMAYRLNLFVCDALPVLLGLKLPDVSIDVALRPVTEFLSNYINVLRRWLYKDNNRRVLECLWIFIVQDFELELLRLDKSEDDTEEKGQLLVQALAHLLKFMNSQEEGLSRELLLSQAEDISFRLSLHAMPSGQLVTLFNKLIANQRAVSEVSSVDTQYDCLLTVRQRLKHDLLTLSKAVSGLDLITWIMTNQELFTNFDPSFDSMCGPFSETVAYNIAQQLLQWGIIENVEGTSQESRMRDSPSESVYNMTFPDITIHAQISRDQSLSPQNSSFVTPRATPRPGLKASLRASSRQSHNNMKTPSGKLERSWHQRSLGTGPGASTIINQSTGGINKSTMSIHPSTAGIREATVVIHQTTASPSKSTKGIHQSTTSINKSTRSISESIASNHQSSIANNQSTGGLRQSTRVKDIAGGETTDSGISSCSGMQVCHSSRTPDPSFDTDTGLESSLPSVDTEAYGIISEQNADFDPYLRCSSPASMNSCDSRFTVFDDSKNAFYYICPYVGQKLETNHKNFELYHLVEECFQKKVTPEYLAKIIYSRRKQDGTAREFTKQLHWSVIERIKHAMNESEVPTCVSS